MQESAVGLTAGVPFRYRGVSRENLPIPSPNVIVILPVSADSLCPELKTCCYIGGIIPGKFYRMTRCRHGRMRGRQQEYRRAG